MKKSPKLKKWKSKMRWNLMGHNNISVKRINDILETTIYSIESSKEEIINIVEEARENVKLAEKELEDINEKVAKQ